METNSIMTITNKGVEIRSIHLKKEEKKDKLKFKVWNYKNVLLYEIEVVDKTMLSTTKTFIASNGWAISLDSHVVGRISVFSKLIATGHPSAKVHCIDFIDTKSAKKTVREIRQAVREFNESQNQILDEKEKEYLSHLIAPFRDRIKSIIKYNGGFIVNGNISDYIVIEMVEKRDGIPLPCFEQGTMYKGMELNKHYTLKELGL